MDKLEKRYTTECELRVDRDEDGVATITGFAAVFNKWSVDLGGWTEKIARGAFSNVLDNDPDTRALVDHDASMIIGRTTAGTLFLSEKRAGLAVEILPPDTQVGRDIVTNIEAGNVTGMSFAFRLAPDGDEWHEDKKGNITRTVLEVGELADVSTVTYPAYPDTSVAVRSLDEWRKVNAPEPKGDAKPKTYPRANAKARIELAKAQS